MASDEYQASFDDSNRTPPLESNVEVKTNNEENNNDELKLDENNDNLKTISVNDQEQEQQQQYYRPLRTKSPRNISIANMEERGGRLTKYTVYIIECDPPPPGVVSVARRYNDFKWLRSKLCEAYPGIFVPPLPPSKVLGRFNESFVEERKRDLNRFLNRIEAIKPFSENIAFQMFLSRPESTFSDGTKEIEDKYFANRSMSSIMYDLNNLFPDFANQSSSDNSNNSNNANNISTEDIPRLKEFIQKLLTTLKDLNDHSLKLLKNFHTICNELMLFDDNFGQLYEIESKYPYKSQHYKERFDIKKPIELWKNYQITNTNIYYDYLYLILRYEYEDIEAFLELFNTRDKIEQNYAKSVKNFASWTQREEKLKSEGKELSSEEEKKKEEAMNETKELNDYLTLVTKIILKSEIQILWKHKIDTWHQQILNFASKQAQLTERMLDTWKSVS